MLKFLRFLKINKCLFDSCALVFFLIFCLFVNLSKQRRIVYESNRFELRYSYKITKPKQYIRSINSKQFF